MTYILLYTIIGYWITAAALCGALLAGSVRASDVSVLRFLGVLIISTLAWPIMLVLPEYRRDLRFFFSLRSNP